jgi:tetratricopeptide (TPR) repeat protein
VAERYEDALPLLTDLLEKRADKTVLTGDATFLLGTCQARMLARKEAVESFTRYLDQNPSAPERMRIAAWRQCEALKQLEEGTMADVYDRMDFSRRHLNLEKSGTDTQEQQETIVAMLTKLIKEAEDRECQCSGGGGQQPNDGSNSQGQGQGKGQQGGNSRNQNGKVVRQYNNGPQSPWSKLRNKERDPAYSAIKEKFPARYQQLIEQYYKSFE